MCFEVPATEVNEDKLATAVKGLGLALPNTERAFGAWPKVHRGTRFVYV